MTDHNVPEQAVAVPQIPTEPQLTVPEYVPVVVDDENDGPIIETDVSDPIPFDKPTTVAKVFSGRYRLGIGVGKCYRAIK
jgi:hypothetical protein